MSAPFPDPQIPAHPLLARAAIVAGALGAPFSAWTWLVVDETRAGRLQPARGA
jgi:hypothetical protein